MLDIGKEKCFQIIDKLIDEGYDVENLAKELPNFYGSFRKRLTRNFGSVGQAFTSYGLYEMNGIPSDIELYRCYEISERYEVVVNDLEKHRIMDLYFIDELTFKKLSKDIVRNMRIDALDEFYRNEFPENLKHTFIEKEEYKHLWVYISNIYGSLRIFLKQYDVDPNVFIERNYGGGHGNFIKAGFRFELLVKRMFDTLGSSYKYNKRVNGCQPDFQLSDRWVDAKLRYNTVFYPTCQTIEKYLDETNNLEIIYCLGEGNRTLQDKDRVTLVHISEYYPKLSEIGAGYLIEEIEEFIHESNKIS